MSRELQIQTPDGQMKSVPLAGERIAVGRSSAAELSFPEDAGLSRQHFVFETQGDDWTVQDMGSKNGTFVNDIPLKAKLILKPGDRITAGHLLITFCPDATSPYKGVVVFDGGQSESPSTSTVVTSLESARKGAAATAAMQALIKAGQELSESRPLEELFPVILDLAVQAVNAQRGVLLLLEGEAAGAEGPQGRRVPDQHQGARPGDQREVFDPGARRAVGRRVQVPA